MCRMRLICIFRLQQAFPDMRVGLLHGRLPASEKDEMMRAFGANEVQVLVATTVVEVGVDVPNATLMIIMDAERFGLSQLHQLRGQGRPWRASILLRSDRGSEVGDGRERMKVMTETDDGFEVPGEIWSCGVQAISSGRSRAGCRISSWRIWRRILRFWSKRAMMRLN